MKHQKHSHIEKPNLGSFGRNEWAILGTTCDKIKQLSEAIIKGLSEEYNMAYADADHKSAGEGSEKNMLSHGATLDFCDKIDFHRLDFKQPLTPFQFKTQFNEQDLVLINGNHFQGNQQIVVLDEKKTDSLKKRLPQLTNVKLILKSDENSEIPDFLKEKLKNLDKIPVKNLKNIPPIIEFIKKHFQKSELRGLILAGGKSQRMGHDKGKINYHGTEQRLFLYDLLEKMGIKPFLSCRNEQVEEFPLGYNYITDSFLNLGPFGAILSAFRQNPNVAYLVIACDLPFLDENILKKLIENRAINKIATAFKGEENDFPEPLITIWEPKAYPILLQFLAQGYSCPRKVLINSDINLLEIEDKKPLSNINFPEELELAKKEIES